MRVGIALGSNVGLRFENLRAARTAILAIPGISEPLLSSHVYETEPVGTDPEAGPFLNAVVEAGYTGHPIALLEALQAVENQMGRPSKRPRNSPRTIDLDILYAGNLVLRNEEIIIPHPRIQLRRFVLQPMSDICPDLILPGFHRSISELLSTLEESAQVEQIFREW